jgi:hypothetical protein
LEKLPKFYHEAKNNPNYGWIIGILKEDLYKLKEQFDKLLKLYRQEKIETRTFPLGANLL